MNKIIHAAARSLKLFYKVLPFFIGLYIYYPIFALQSDRVYPFLDTVYAAIKLYSGSTEPGVRVGGLLQLARFLGMAATFSILVKLFNRMGDLVNRVKLCSSRSTVVYGDSPCTEYVFSSLPHRIRIRGGDRFIGSASRYLIMYSDNKRSLELYSRNYEHLHDRRVYIMLEGVSGQSIENPRLSVFSISENCARQYWRKYPPEKSERIGIMGFDSLGCELLIYGLQMNIIDPGQHFEYHIYGGSSSFEREHTEMDKMAPDSVIFHGSDVCYETVAEYDRIIICGGDVSDNVSAVSRLLAAAQVNGSIYVYAPEGGIADSLFGSGRVTCFGAAEETASADIIFNESSMEAARRQHEYYVNKYGGVPWEKLDAFKRYSNVSSSDYLHTVNRLAEKGVPMETLAELEHIRWCRYHYINNWKYGSITDSSRRIHSCLVPFEKLSEEERLKDIEAIQSKLEEVDSDT